MTSFNLVTEPWIPLVQNGSVREVGLADALVHAAEFDGLSLADPVEGVTLLRLLMAIVIDAGAAPVEKEDWTTSWERGTLQTAEISVYLDQWHDRFDLFSSDRPFLQVPGLESSSGATGPTSLVILPEASGNNVPIFRSRTENESPLLSFAQAARALLVTHAWDTAAIKTGAKGDGQVKAGKTSGNPTGPLGRLGLAVPLGPSLAHTLLLNLPLGSWRSSMSVPHWRRDRPPGPAWESRPATGMVDLLTWTSRRIRLIPTPDGDRIGRVIVCAGDRMLEISHDVEPHSLWRREDKPRAGVPPVRPRRHNAARMAWQGLQGLLTMGREGSGDVTSNVIGQLRDLTMSGFVADETRIDVLCVGVEYGNMSAVVEEVFVDTLPLPVRALPEGDVKQDLLQVAQDAESLQRAANDFGNGLRRAAGGGQLGWDKGERLGDRLVHDLTPSVRRLLRRLQGEPSAADGAVQAWRDEARGLATGVIDEAACALPDAALIGRLRASDDGKKRAYPPVAVERYYRKKIKDILGEPPAVTSGDSDAKGMAS